MAGASQAIHIYFTPTANSRLNLIERWFLDLTGKRLRGAFGEVRQLINTTIYYIKIHNANLKSITWTAQAKNILEKVRRARAKLDNLQSS